jgi:hypothetical protein
VSDPAPDFVADRSYVVEVLACRFVEVAVFVACAGIVGQVSPQPMVMTTSEALTATLDKILGCSPG